MGKSGKFMNPTDQARKEARRRELKKNKKQRQQVREAVIKQKDPKHILNDLDALDNLQFDINNPPPYSAKVFQEKRRRLKDQWSKIYQFYQKEDPKLAYELKQMELDYERRHQMMSQHYESIMQAQKVKLEDIPLPDMEAPPPMPPPLIIPPLMPTQNIDFNLLQTPPPPPPVETVPSSKGILKSTSSSTNSCSGHQISEQIKLKLKKLAKIPPGPPLSEPPDLNEFACDDDEKELGLTLNDEFKLTDKPKKIRFDENLTTTANIPAKPLQFNTGIAYPAPQIASQIVISSTAHPKQNSKPSIPHQSLPQPPPPPPPSQPYPQRNIATQKTAPYQQQAPHAPPTINSTAATTTIEAKPVLRNKVAEITKFVPTNLIVRRDQTSKNKPVYQKDQQSSFPSMGQPYNYMSYQQQQYTNLNPLNYSTATNFKSSTVTSVNTNNTKNDSNNSSNSNNNQKSTDAAYESFMKEISGLL